MALVALIGAIALYAVATVVRSERWQRLLEDEDFSQRLRAVENDLLDDFARERLQGEARARAAVYFAATPADRARLRIARALAVVAGAAPVHQSIGLRVEQRLQALASLTSLEPGDGVLERRAELG